MAIILWILLVVYLLVIFITIGYLLLQNRPPEQTSTWALTIFFIPIIGLFLYYNFGRNYRKNKVFSRKALFDQQQLHKFSYEQRMDVDHADFEGHGSIDRKKSIIKLLLNNSKSILTMDNNVALLSNGEETFNSIVQELKEAQDHIHFEFYIFLEDNIGSVIRNILLEKARKGVKVRFMYDGLGSMDLSKDFISRMEEAGAEVYAFSPVRFPYFANYINYRNHRKIIVIDGKVGYVGGINIADRYKDGHSALGIWRDTHLRLEGSSVHSLQAVFLNDWHYVSNKEVTDDQYFPYHPMAEKVPVQITSSGPDSDWESIMQAYFKAITTANDSVAIITPYFMPPTSIITALKTAALSGVDVKVILPAMSDVPFLLYSSFSFVQELLEAGVAVFLYQNGFNHSKIIIVDDVIASVGSANLDRRSFEKNLEINAMIYNKEFARELREKFEEDLANSEEVNLATFSQRSLSTRLTESIARVFSQIM